MQTADIILYDDHCQFRPVLQEVLDELAFYEKTLVKGPAAKKQSPYKRVEPFFIKNSGGSEVGGTYPGFWQKISSVYLKNRYIPNIIDRRRSNSGFEALPAPALDKMYGFRFSQEELLTKGLVAQRSGLIGAPTRYGKTCLIVNTVRAFPTATICLVAPGVDLVKQLYSDLTGKFGVPGRKVHLVHGSKSIRGPVMNSDIVVCSVDSLEKINPNDFDLLLADEPHALVTPKRLKLINSFPRARRIGFGATLTGRFDGRDSLIEGVFGPVIVERTYKEAVEEGAICPIKVLFFEVNITPKWFRDHDQAYNGYFLKNRSMAELTGKICKDVIPAEFQTLVFIKHEQQADLYQDAIGHDTSIAMAKKLTSKERDELTELVRVNEIKRCLCTKIYVQGVTFSDIRVLINAEGGGDNTSAIQKPGRLAEIRPGKTCGILIDFYFKPTDEETSFGQDKDNWKSLCSESRARERAYKKKGYDIVHVNSIDSLQQEFNKLI